MRSAETMKLFLVTDAWRPQINGVVRSLERMIQILTERGTEVEVASPLDFASVPCPSYPEISLALWSGAKLARRIEAFCPSHIHISTEGPLGWAARAYCRAHGLPFTTAYHTRFPEYVHARCRLPLDWSYAVLRRFHNGATRMMVSTQSIQSDLEMRGFRNIVRWGRGVDLKRFHPRPDDDIVSGLARPIHLYVGRVAVEKNVPAFLDLDLPGTKLVVGDGPQLDELRRRFPDAVFTGHKTDDELARYYAAADIFVFPSLTDTFGLVLLEALASGTPVAAFPVPGPVDVIGDLPVGGLHADLREAINIGLRADPAQCRAHGETHSWERSADEFQSNLAPITGNLEGASRPA